MAQSSSRFNFYQLGLTPALEVIYRPPGIDLATPRAMTVLHASTGAIKVANKLAVCLSPIYQSKIEPRSKLMLK